MKIHCTKWSIKKEPKHFVDILRMRCYIIFLSYSYFSSEINCTMVGAGKWGKEVQISYVAGYAVFHNICVITSLLCFPTKCDAHCFKDINQTSATFYDILRKLKGKILMSYDPNWSKEYWK